jgi:hypothetical protein
MKVRNIFMFIKENEILHFRKWNLFYLAHRICRKYQEWRYRRKGKRRKRERVEEDRVLWS